MTVSASLARGEVDQHEHRADYERTETDEEEQLGVSLAAALAVSLGAGHRSRYRMKLPSCYTHRPSTEVGTSTRAAVFMGGVIGMIAGFITGVIVARQVDPGYVDLPNLLAWALACAGAVVGSHAGYASQGRR